MRIFGIHLGLLLSVFLIVNGHGQGPLEFVQSVYLKASNTDAGDEFGTSVAISGDLMVVGAPSEDSGATGVNGDQSDNSRGNSGAAYVFRQENGQWVQEAYLKASNTDFLDRFGERVAISGDVIVVGTRFERSGATGVNGDQSDNSAGSNLRGAGAAYVFRRENGQWSQEAYLKASNTDDEDQFGVSVAISGDAIVVGASFEDSGATGVNGDQGNNSRSNSGAAYVFRREDGEWSQEAYLKASNTDAADIFGARVAISGDVIVVGARNENGSSTGVNGEQNNSGFDSGAAYVFRRENGEWSLEAYLKASNTGSSDQFGASVAISGELIVVGASNEESIATGVNGDQSDNSADNFGINSGAGAAYVFQRENELWSQIAYLKASNTDDEDQFGVSVAISGETVVASTSFEDGAGRGLNNNAASNGAVSSGAGYIFEMGETRGQPEFVVETEIDGEVVEFTDQFEFSRTELNGRREQEITIRNEGEADLVISSLTVDSASYLIEETVEGQTLPPNTAATFTLVFSPTVVDENPANLRVNSNDPDENLVNLSLLGQGGFPAITLIDEAGNSFSDEVELDFGNVFSGSVNPVSFTLRNTGIADLDLSFISQGTFFLSVDQDVLEPGEEAQLTLSFEPSFSGAHNERLELGFEGGGISLFSLSVTGLAYTPLELAQSAYLKASNTDEEDIFGESVAISGNLIVVGAPRERSVATGVNGDQSDNSADESNGSGAAYVFRRENEQWVQEAYLKASNTDEGDEFGVSVAISGETIVVGAPGEDSSATGVDGDQSNNLTNSGAAYVFRRENGEWSQEAYLKASNTGGGDRFGAIVDISGETIVVDAPGEDSSATGVDGDQSDGLARDSGAAYVFRRENDQWSQEAYLKASNTDGGDSFGESVAISGETIVVGAFSEDSAATGVDGDQSDNSVSFSGAVYVFQRENGQWSQEAYLKASNTDDEDQFGASVAVSEDVIVVGARCEDSATTGVNGDQSDNSESGSGAAYVFRRENGQWSQEAYLKASNTDRGDQFGESVAISGETIVVGAFGEQSSARGANGDQSDNSSGSVFRGSGAAYVFNRENGLWRQEAYLKASNTDGGDSFGESVAISGGTIVVGAPEEDSSVIGINGEQNDNSAEGAGAVYVFLEGPFPSRYVMAVQAAGLTGLNGLPEAIPFNDGVNNLLKYAFNLDLSGPDNRTLEPNGVAGLPFGEAFALAGDPFFRFEYVGLTNNDVIYEPQMSSTLEPGSFVPIPGVPSQESIDTEWERFTFETPIDPENTPRNFFRVDVRFR